MRDYNSSADFYPTDDDVDVDEAYNNEDLDFGIYSDDNGDSYDSIYDIPDDSDDVDGYQYFPSGIDDLVD